MEWFLVILDFIGQQILNVPAYLVGIITAVGLIALRRPVGTIIGGSLKAALGFLILGAGAGVVVASLTPLGDLILKVTGAQGVIPTNEVITALAAEEFGATSAYVLVVGFIVMLLLARFTPLKYVFLTGHHMVFMAMMLAVVLSVGFGSELSWLVVVIGGGLLGVIMVVMPAFAQPWTKRITGDDTIAIGHFGTLGYIAAGAVGQAVGKRSKSTEHINFPQNLRFLRDSMVATSVSMVAIYMVFAIWGLIALPRADALAIFGSVDGGAFIMAAFAQALQFGVGVAIILYGVRTILGELVPAFQGIAEKVVPGARPALDIPIVFPFAANAVLIGFLASFAGGLISLGVLAIWLGPVFGLALILPGMVPHFFTGGGAGVYGNATGGRIGAMVGGFVNGILITILPAILLLVLGNFGFANSTFGDADFGWFGTLIGVSLLGDNTAIGVMLTVLIGVVLVVAAIIFQVKVTNKGWMPGAKHTAFVDAIEADVKAAAAAAKAEARAARLAAAETAKTAEPADKPA
ncbi:PTS system, ascorbate-specific IIC component [Cryobacterium flavum]|uniref:Ascorbate-specific PTS system EIIC component n=1 Tax=Cryobacterium flavum TaxID=1424659 RepID=A0A4R8VEI3_9MICO|nr:MULTISPECIES: PTS ascorbate transporter subunit IIC [Cryobacterium]TFB81225.1 PTS ascorbate transporter subunit IIC [Cryobacterium flavum]TFD05511.1 PTS ascorbate transporter subunit IIC [Cryobacterium sp. TMT1-66-1]TFD10936.1 PTS ascorbate transporter subunit IIC [Cryobacterium sp. TMT1-2-2]SDM69748.1 PTS system, ascorbate-specific IIC component [Cryobacterium flavum]